MRMIQACLVAKHMKIDGEFAVSGVQVNYATKITMMCGIGDNQQLDWIESLFRLQIDRHSNVHTGSEIYTFVV